MNHTKRDQQMRQRIAIEAARIMEEEGMRDFFAAKRKAAERLGAPDTRNMPKNAEIESARAEYQRLFKQAIQPSRLRALRAAAVHAMRHFEPFEPRLVGSVLSGTASVHSDVNLHVFAETAEEVQLFLREKHIPFETAERRFRINHDTEAAFPVYRFLAGDVLIDVAVFPKNGLRQAPLSPVDQHPMQRANLSAVEAWLAER